MKRAFRLILALLMLFAVALADADDFLDDTQTLVRSMNGNLAATTDETNGLFTEFYAYDDSIIYTTDDGQLSLDILPKGDWAAVRMFTLIARDAEHIDAALNAVATLAYYYGSNDSLAAVEQWTDANGEALKTALADGSDPGTPVLQCPAFVGMASVIHEEAPALKFTIMP